MIGGKYYSYQYLSRSAKDVTMYLIMVIKHESYGWMDQIQSIHPTVFPRPPRPTLDSNLDCSFIDSSFPLLPSHLFVCVLSREKQTDWSMPSGESIYNNIPSQWAAKSRPARIRRRTTATLKSRWHDGKKSRISSGTVAIGLPRNAIWCEGWIFSSCSSPLLLPLFLSLFFSIYPEDCFRVIPLNSKEASHSLIQLPSWQDLGHSGLLCAIAGLG